MLNIQDIIDEYGEDLVTMDNYDDCIMGVCERFGQTPIIAYDRSAVINKLINNGMIHEDAEEWFSFNMIGAWVGDATPCFITTSTFEAIP